MLRTGQRTLACLSRGAWIAQTGICLRTHALPDVNSSWIAYSEDTVIPTKVFKVYPNSKPWVSKSLKSLLLLRKGTPRYYIRFKKRLKGKSG